MKPTKDFEYTLVDLVDVILNKGVIINADVVISLAGVPLIGVNLRAAIAGMETMLKYGMMQAWDESVRREYAREIGEISKPPLGEDEEVVLHTFGSHYYARGIYNTWRPGELYLTNKRLFVHRKMPGEMLFETPLQEIKGLTIARDEYFVDALGDRLLVLLESGEIARLNAGDIEGLKTAIEKRMEEMGLTLEEKITLPKPEALCLTEGEEVLQREKVWYQAPASGIIGATWRPGWAYVTNKRVCWCYNDQPLFEIPINSITEIAIRKNHNPVENERVLVLSHRTSRGESMALFSGNEERIDRLKRAVEKEQAAVIA